MKALFNNHVFSLIKISFSYSPLFHFGNKVSKIHKDTIQYPIMTQRN